MSQRTWEEAFNQAEDSLLHAKKQKLIQHCDDHCSDGSVDMVLCGADYFSLSIIKSYFKKYEHVFSCQELEITEDTDKLVLLFAQLILFRLISNMKSVMRPKQGSFRLILDELNALIEDSKREEADFGESEMDIIEILRITHQKTLTSGLAQFSQKYLPEESEEIIEQQNNLEKFIDTLFDFDFSNVIASDQNRKEIIIKSLHSTVKYILEEITELAGNATRMIETSFIGKWTLKSVLSNDEELKVIFPNSMLKKNGFLLIIKHLFNTHTQSYETKNCNTGIFNSISLDLHLEILKRIGDYKELLRMRRVCKYWNSLIVANDEIWKFCTYLTLSKDSLFVTCKIDEIMKPGDQSWMEYFFSVIYPQIESRDSLVRLKIRDLIENEETQVPEQLENSLRSSIRASIVMSENIDEDELGNNTALTKVGGLPTAPKHFKKDWVEKGYSFIGQINCGQVHEQCKIPYDLPKTGMLYFFASVTTSGGEPVKIDSSDGYVLYEECNIDDIQDIFFDPEEDNYLPDSNPPQTFNLSDGITFDSSIFCKLNEDGPTVDYSLTRVLIQNRFHPFSMGSYMGVYQNNGIREDEVVLFETLTKSAVLHDHNWINYMFIIDINELRRRNFTSVRLKAEIKPNFEDEELLFNA